MRLEWLDDLLAVAEYGSIQKAAEARHLTQPAFSRRLRAIEQHVGVELFDRRRKPTVPNEVLQRHANDIVDLAWKLRKLRSDLREFSHTNLKKVSIASQHALTTSVMPKLMQRLAARDDLQMRLRSANREECWTMFLTRQVDFALVYETDTTSINPTEPFVEALEIGRDRLIPVHAAANIGALNRRYASGILPVVSYPGTVFLGQLFEREIAPYLEAHVAFSRTAETALTPAVRELALAGVGCAWLPRALVARDIAAKQLHDLSDRLPSCSLRIIAARFSSPRSEAGEHVWSAIKDAAY
ncbi:MAG: LysR family transcriptional regulator [Alphaproteobacteria bacterium]|nr:LysR family transcriptional regulator [Alphaproteobacteria bacterium]